MTEQNIDMENKLVVFKTFNNPIEANITRGLLETHGIECFLQDENTVYVNPVYTTALGGIKLWIKESDYSDAVKICCDESKNEDQILCPECSSGDISIRSRPNWFLFILMFLSAVSTPNSGNRKRYKCKKCGFSWAAIENHE